MPVDEYTSANYIPKDEGRRLYVYSSGVQCESTRAELESVSGSVDEATA